MRIDRMNLLYSIREKMSSLKFEHLTSVKKYIVPIAKVATEGDEKRNGNSGRSE